MWRLNNMLMNNYWVSEEIKREITAYLKTNESENTTCQNLWDSAKDLLRRKIIVIQPQLKKKRKFSNKQSNLTSKRTRKRTNEAYS